MGSTAIYAIARGQTYDTLTVQSTWTQQKDADGFNPNYSSFCSFLTDTPVLLAMDSKTMHIDAYQLAADGTTLTLKQPTRVHLAYDAIRGFTIGGAPHVLAYEAISGTIDFYRMTSDLALDSIYSYRRTYGHVTTGYTTIEPYDYRGTMLLLGYNRNSGDVVLDQLRVTSSAPLSASPVWTSKWAAGWTRFTLFKMGDENFFLKSNVDKGNTVYIDHFVDDPAEGSHPVGRDLPALAPTAISPLAFDGIPYFASYNVNGNASLQRIHCNCQGWSEAAAFEAVIDAAHIVPLYAAGRTYVLIY